MEITRLAMENFGPYYGEHEVDLSVSPSAPVVVIHGENMRGKTSLQHAIRWCLYGTVGTRMSGRLSSDGTGIRPTFRLINYDAVDEGMFYMSVTLQFEHDGHRFDLERHVQATKRPRSDKDLRRTYSLRRDGQFVEDGDVQSVIESILHHDISRFFLFDGEMLAEYETLVADSGRNAFLIRQSIEKILGLPALQLGADDVAGLEQETLRQMTRALRQTQKSQQLAQEAEALDAQVEQLEADAQAMRDRLSDRLGERDELMQRRSAFEGIEADVREAERLEQSMAEQERRRGELREEVADLLTRSWWEPVHAEAATRLGSLEAEVAEVIESVTNAEQLRREIAALERVLSGNICPSCGQVLGAEERERAGETLRNREEALKALGPSVDISQQQRWIAQLRRFASAPNLGVIVEKERSYRRLGLDISQKRRELEQVNERIRGHNRSDIAETQAQYDLVVIEISDLQRDLDSAEQTLREKRAILQQRRRQIEHTPGVDPKTSLSAQAYAALGRGFRGAIDAYRTDLRVQVEQEASAIFQRLTTEPEYAGLRINDAYGLDIVDMRGRTITDRSAGAEQIVAFALIGALNRCAVRVGPIVMDTPFGRLDRLHRENILKFLPTMGPQIVLLVQSGEMNETSDLEPLAGKIRARFRLIRDSAPTRTRVERIGAAT